MKRIYMFLFLCVCCSTSYAQRILTVDEAIATALKNNYAILLLQNDSASYALDASYKNAAFFPRLNANVGTVWNNNNQKQVLSDGTKRQSTGLKSNNTTAQLALNWTLFDGFKMFATREKVDEFVRLGELAIRNQVVQTVSSVITTYYNIVRQKQQLKAIEDQMSISNERVKLAQYKLDIGVGTKPDLLQSKLDLNEQRAAQMDQQSMIARLKVELNQLMVQPASPEYDVSDSIPINMHLVLEDLRKDIRKSSPALQLAQKNIDIARLTLKERMAERYPTVSFNSAYNFNRTQNQSVLNSFSTLFNRTNGFNYGFTASIPIFNNYNVRRQIQQAQITVNYQQLLYNQQENDISFNIINAYLDYELQKRILELEEENILLAKENVDIVFQVYKLNSTTQIQLKEAQKSLEDAYTRLITARYNTKVAETELLRLNGGLVR
jgi:outer membrane protein